jgi:DNA (cytosine-5)-methyltransferase 1
MKLLDLFCGAGGAAMGYYRAGFEDITGVDNKPQPNYPFEFILGDALEYVIDHGAEFDVIHASPPCQAYSITKSLPWVDDYPELIEPLRNLLKETDKPYVIENVLGAPLINPLELCGSMFGLPLIRHRLFECNPPIWFPPQPHACKHLYTNSSRDYSSFKKGVPAG